MNDRIILTLLLIATIFVIFVMPLIYDPNFYIDIILGLTQ